MNQIAFALEQPVGGVRQIAGDLIHPKSVCFGRDAGNLDAARRQLNVDSSMKNRIKKRWSPLGVQTSTIKKSAATSSSPVLSKKLFPGCFSNSVRC
jgi:hypothetical protein